MQMNIWIIREMEGRWDSELHDETYPFLFYLQAHFPRRNLLLLAFVWCKMEELLH